MRTLVFLIGLAGCLSIGDLEMVAHISKLLCAIWKTRNQMVFNHKRNPICLTLDMVAALHIQNQHKVLDQTGSGFHKGQLWCVNCGEQRYRFWDYFCYHAGEVLAASAMIFILIVEALAFRWAIELIVLFCLEAHTSPSIISHVNRQANRAPHRLVRFTFLVHESHWIKDTPPQLVDIVLQDVMP